MRKFSLSLLIVLAVAVLAAGTGGILYLSTAPEQRHTIFWISMGTLGVGVGISALVALLHLWSDSDRAFPFPFTVSLASVAGGYTLFALAAALAAWRFVDFSLTGYLITHVAGGMVFALGAVFALMGAVQAASEERGAARGRARFMEMAREVELMAGGHPGESAVACRKLAEALRFSDPVTPRRFAVEDEEVERAVARVRESGGAPESVQEALTTLRRRNDLVARGK